MAVCLSNPEPEKDIEIVLYINFDHKLSGLKKYGKCNNAYYGWHFQ